MGVACFLFLATIFGSLDQNDLTYLSSFFNGRFYGCILARRNNDEYASIMMHEKNSDKQQ